MSRTETTFTTISSAGGLLPAALLARLADARDELPGTGPTDYGLIDTKKVKSAINEAWNDLLGQWEKFRSHVPPPADRDHDARYLSDTRTMWLLPLFQTLGWGQLEPAVPDQQLELDGTPKTGLVADGRHFPLTHETDGAVPVHLLGAGVPLDRRTKGVPGAADQSPHSMLQELLNVSDRHLWAITSNGEQLRILRDTTSLTRQAYVEFDLATMFDNQVFSDFAVLWLICHRTRFPQPDAPADCWLEQWQSLAAEQGVRALDDLRDGVAAAIEALATGLVDHPNNTGLRDRIRNGDVDDLDLYRQVLRTVYRMMFLLVVEDRNLLHAPDTPDEPRDRYARHYSMDRLRTQARNHLGGRHGDGWQQWQTLTGRLGTQDGIPQLGVPSLVGGLFDPNATPLLDGTEMSNRLFYEAVRRLAFVQRESALHRIDFRNLGSEELGSVYEALLEMQPTVDLTARTFRLGTVAGNERKTTGSFYTPTSLINVLLNEALDPVVDQAIADAEMAGEDVEDAILSITVCDPAMGSAHFLVGAAFRLAKRLAQVRTTEAEPSPEQVQQALRDVVSRCLYGVDINPMAVELAKVSLWLECHVPGQPMTFLDHHLKHGNSLLGVGFDTSIIDYHRHGPHCGHGKDEGFDGGLPSDAFKPLATDDKKTARSMRNASDSKAEGQFDLFSGEGDEFDFEAALATMASYALKIAYLDDSDVAALATKQQAHMLYGQKDELARLKLRADAWTATWTIPKTKDVFESGTTDLPYHVYYDSHYNGMPGPDRNGVRMSRDEADRLGFFHWFVEFPDIAEHGGFDLIIGNPPWETVQADPTEWFPDGHPVVEASNTTQRDTALAALRESEDVVDQRLHSGWRDFARAQLGLAHFIKQSKRFPLGGVGRIKTDPAFVDFAVSSLSPRGAAGLIVPTAVISDFTFRDFFATLVDEQRVVSAHTAIEIRDHFPGITSGAKPFTLLTVRGSASDEPTAFTSAFLSVSEIGMPHRTFSLSADQIRMVNPNTRTAPLFRTRTDAELVTRIYAQHPVMDVKEDRSNPWRVTFHVGVVSRSSRADSSLYSSTEEPGCLPMYEAKMLHQFDHRWATFDQGEWVPVSVAQKKDPQFECRPETWFPEEVVRERISGWGWNHELLLVWRDVTNSTNSRTCIASLIPISAANNACLVATPASGLSAAILLLCFWDSFAFDYIARTKIPGTHLSDYVMSQLPVPEPKALASSAAWASDSLTADWLGSRAAALSATTHDVAMGLGYDAPVVWNETQRELWRTELDAAIFSIYGYTREDIAYVMDTFNVIRDRDRTLESVGNESDARWNMWRTKRLILGKYDELTEHANAGTTYFSPDGPPPLPHKLRMHTEVSA